MGGKLGRAFRDADGVCAVMPQDNAMCERLTIRAGLGVASFPT